MPEGIPMTLGDVVVKDDCAALWRADVEKACYYPAIYACSNQKQKDAKKETKNMAVKSLKPRC